MDVPSGVDALLNYPAATRFAARASRAFFRLASSAAFRAGDIFFFAGAFFTAAFSALWIAAQRFLVAATIAALPSSTQFPFRLRRFRRGRWRWRFRFSPHFLPIEAVGLLSCAFERQQRISSA